MVQLAQTMLSTGYHAKKDAAGAGKVLIEISCYSRDGQVMKAGLPANSTWSQHLEDRVE